MIETANEWLEDHPDYDVINCETIKILFKYNDNQNFYELRFNDIFNYVFGTEKNLLLKALRVWIKKKNLEKQETNTNQKDAGYSTDSLLSPDTPQQESPKISNFTSVLKRRWTTTQQQLQRLPNKIATAQNSAKNQPHSTDHSPKKSAFQQQQAFRLQQYSSQSKFFLNKLQRQASCPQSNNFQAAHLQQANLLAQNTQSHNVKQTHNQQNNCSSSQQQQQLQTRNANQSTNQNEKTQSTTNQRKKQGKSINSNVINYIDILPEYKEVTENSKLEKFERLDDCLEKLNRLIRDGKINGKILNVETGCLEASVNWKIDPSISFTAITSKNVNFLRCFFIENGKPELNEKIHIIDFIPDSIYRGGFFKRPKFENFSLLLPKVTEWLVKNQNVYAFKNAQTLDIKLKSCKFLH